MLGGRERRLDGPRVSWRLAIIKGLLPEDWLADTALGWSTDIAVLLMLAILVAGRSRELVREQREDAGRGRVIGRSAHYMLAMVNDPIEYAGGAADSLHVAPVYIHAFIDGMAHEGMSLARKHDNTFVLDGQAPLPALLTFDAKRVRQVLGNLLDNADGLALARLLELCAAPLSV